MTRKDRRKEIRQELDVRIRRENEGEDPKRERKGGPKDKDEKGVPREQ